MMQPIIDFLIQLGWIGLLIGVAFEALSIPIPSSFFIVFYGYMLKPGLLEIFLIGLLITGVYIIFSFVPYWLSIKFEDKLKSKISKKKMKKAMNWIDKYGDWSIALGRIFGMGYIAFIGGFCKIKPMKYALLTFIGVYPLAVLFVYLGTLGNIKAINGMINHVSWWAGGIILIIAVIIFGMKYLRKRNRMAHEQQ
ncbi:DedA family protein [Falsibacillus pallidus]|uniref:Membrane protein DedA with SNARE-associated domain n=1 Tax=Falsibacillus pallidus TaxID=493781 RepID=A0A370GH58_9BACI|nr:VTT domain-containing protein [Falsibacillus pallidus]RDI43138.1 membrane protein DedA with SNARE-associated domain [Falsibacillus pallidus]